MNSYSVRIFRRSSPFLTVPDNLAVCWLQVQLINNVGAVNASLASPLLGFCWFRVWLRRDWQLITRPRLQGQRGWSPRVPGAGPWNWLRRPDCKSVNYWISGLQTQYVETVRLIYWNKDFQYTSSLSWADYRVRNQLTFCQKHELTLGYLMLPRSIHINVN